jgi:monofunctional glycosyltransferase
MAISSRRRGWQNKLIYGVVLGVIATAGPVLLLRWLPAPTTSFMLQASVHAYRQGQTTYRTQYQWTAWDKIADNMKIAVLAAEDQRFAWHHGFDFTEIGTAIQQGGRPRGASTISQQVAKNLFLWPGRSYLRKVLEAYLTTLLELCWPKQRILEMYLNIAQFGDGIYGVAAASHAYFGTPPGGLTPTQSALLAAALPNPLRLQVRHPNQRLRVRQERVLLQMDRLGGAGILAPLRPPK